MFLLEALERLFARRPDARERVKVILAGVFTAEDRAVAERYPFLALRDFVPHAGRSS